MKYSIIIAMLILLAGMFTQKIPNASAGLNVEGVPSTNNNPMTIECFVSDSFDEIDAYEGEEDLYRKRSCETETCYVWTSLGDFREEEEVSCTAWMDIRIPYEDRLVEGGVLPAPTATPLP